jgi:hypothetical protein
LGFGRPHAGSFTPLGPAAGAFLQLLIFSVKLSTTSNITGIRKIAITDAASIPPITTVPNIRRETEPDPVANHSGRHPKINAKAVIRIGRNRILAPVRAASSMLFPPSYSDLENSTIRMAFFAARPISRIRPFRHIGAESAAKQPADIIMKFPDILVYRIDCLT